MNPPAIEDLRATFEEQGYLCLREQVLPEDAVEEARALVEQLLARAPAERLRDLAAGSPDGGTIVEVDRPIEAEPALAATALLAACRDVAARLLGVDVELHYEHLIVKEPHNLAATAWHQDAAYGYPERRRPPAAHLWVPLHQVSEEQGCMSFVPGSHRRPLPHRRRGGRRSPVLAADPPDTTGAVLCPLPAGGLTVHHPQTLHATGPNATDRPRLAWILQFRPVGSSVPPTLLDRVRYRLRRQWGR